MVWDTAIFLKLLINEVSEGLAEELDGLLPTSQRSHVSKGIFLYNRSFSKMGSGVMARGLYTFSKSSEDRAVFHSDQKPCLLRWPRLFSCPLLSWTGSAGSAQMRWLWRKCFHHESWVQARLQLAGQCTHSSLSRSSIRDASRPLVVWAAERTADLDFLSRAYYLLRGIIVQGK